MVYFSGDRNVRFPKDPGVVLCGLLPCQFPEYSDPVLRIHTVFSDSVPYHVNGQATRPQRRKETKDMYCEKCNRIIDGDRCPVCKRSSVREPEPKDPCFLTEQDYISTGILEDVLKQNANYPMAFRGIGRPVPEERCDGGGTGDKGRPHAGKKPVLCSV